MSRSNYSSTYSASASPSPSPRSLGVLESGRLLEDAIRDMARDSTRLSTEDGRAALAEVYLMAGHLAGQTTMDKCMRIIKDTGEPAEVKVGAIRVLNLLMELNNDQLAHTLVNNLKFFKDVAKKSKEKDRKKKRPHGIFPPKTSDQDAAMFVTAICELMDKWGRHYSGDAQSDLFGFAKARSDLIAERAKLPSDSSPYSYLDPVVLGVGQASGPGAGGGGGGGFYSGGMPGDGDQAPSSGAFNERTLDRMAENAREAIVNQGPDSEAAASATSIFEAELQKWRGAVDQAAELGDFVEVQRLSEVTSHYAEVKDGIESLASSTAASRSASAVSARSATPDPAAARSREHKKHRHRSRDPPSRPQEQQSQQEQPSAGVQWGQSEQQPGAWPQAAWGSGMQGTAPSAPPQQQQQQQQQQPAQFGDPNSASMSMDYPPPGSGGPSAGAGVGDFLEGPPASASGSGPAMMATGAGPGSYRGGGGGGHYTGMPQEYQPQSTQSTRNQGNEAMRLELQDVTATCNALRQANTQLQHEMDRCRKELRESRRRLAVAEDKIREREDTISELRQRLFESKEQTAKLEDVSKEQAEVQNALQGRLQSARDQTQATETQLRNLQTSLRLSSEAMQRSSGYMPYGSGRKIWDTRLLPTDSRQVLSPNVDASDELAATKRLEQDRESPHKFGFRQGSTARLHHTGDFEEAPKTPVIPRSSPEEWARSTVVSQPPPVVLSHPPPSAEVAATSQDRFRHLLLEQRGVLFEDSRLRIELTGIVGANKGSSATSYSRPGLLFEVVVTNVGSNSLTQVELAAAEPSRTHACELRVQPHDPSFAQQGVVLWKNQSTSFAGRLDVFAPFEATPPLELKFLLPDGLSARMRFRLPLALPQMMVDAVEAGKLPEPKEAHELWMAPDFAQTEVSFSCILRPDLLGPSAPFSIWRCLQMGGAFKLMSGLDGNAHGAIFASLYPQRDSESPVVLLRAELGGATGVASSALQNAVELPVRIAVRSQSHLVNRAIAQVALELLCAAPQQRAVAPAGPRPSWERTTALGATSATVPLMFGSVLGRLTTASSLGSARDLGSLDGAGAAFLSSSSATRSQNWAK